MKESHALKQEVFIQILFSGAKVTLQLQMSISLSVRNQNPSTAWKHHSSSFILHPSSFFIHPSFNLYSTFIHPSSSFILPSFCDFQAFQLVYFDFPGDLVSDDGIGWSRMWRCICPLASISWPGSIEYL